MKLSTRQAGFSIVELVLVVAVVFILGFLGYTFYTAQANKAAQSGDNQAASQSATDTNAESTQAITTTADLDAAAATIDQADLGNDQDADIGQLETELANF